MSVQVRRAPWHRIGTVATGILLAVALAAGGNLLSGAITTVPRTQHWSGHLSFAAGLAVLLVTAWRSATAGGLSRLPAIGLAVLLAGQLLEAAGAFGWAEFDGYRVVDPRLAGVHQLGIILFPPGFLTVLAGLWVGGSPSPSGSRSSLKWTDHRLPTGSIRWSVRRFCLRE